MIELLKSIKTMMDIIATIAGIAVAWYGVILGGVWNAILIAMISLAISVFLGIIIKIKERKSLVKVKERIADSFINALNSVIKEEIKTK